jgi:diketogulonate reductase-like aldo/keto reductase
MRYETLFDGKKIPVIGLGTWNIGGGMSSDYSADEKNIRSIQNAIYMGYTHIDTAQMYGAGHTEVLVGRAVKPFRRNELFITTKVWSSNLSRRDVLKGVEESLKRLDQLYIDLLLIHWPNPAIPIEETMGAFNELVHEGTVKYVGVSNFSLAQLLEAQKQSDVPIATNQVEYNVLCREPEQNGMLEYCQKNGVILTAYEPLGKGSVLRHRTLQEIAKLYTITVAQLAIYWLLNKPKVITIPKSTNEKHLRENIAVPSLNLPAELLQKVETVT